MIGHFRHCPKHGGAPLPCRFCALADAPPRWANTAVAVLEPPEPQPVPEEPVTLPNETVVLLDEPLPRVNEPAEPAPQAQTETNVSEPSKKKRGRPSKSVIPPGVDRNEFYRQEYRKREAAKAAAKAAKEALKPKTKKELAAGQKQARADIAAAMPNVAEGLDKEQLADLASDPAKTAEVIAAMNHDPVLATQGSGGSMIEVVGYGKKPNENISPVSVDQSSDKVQFRRLLERPFRGDEFNLPQSTLGGLRIDYSHPKEWDELDEVAVQKIEWIDRLKNDPQLAGIDPELRKRLFDPNASVDEIKKTIETIKAWLTLPARDIQKVLVKPEEHEGNSGAGFCRRVNTSAPDDEGKISGQTIKNVQGIEEHDQFKSLQEELTLSLFEQTVLIAPTKDSEWKHLNEDNETSVSQCYRCGICPTLQGGKATDTICANREDAWKHFLEHKGRIADYLLKFLPSSEMRAKLKSIDSTHTGGARWDGDRTFTRREKLSVRSLESARQAVLGDPLKNLKPAERKEMREVHLTEAQIKHQKRMEKQIKHQEWLEKRQQKVKP